MNEKEETILIGLGNFGKKVVENFNTLMYERNFQLSAEQRNNIVHSITFQVDQPFNYSAITKEISELVKNSESRLYNKPFSYIIAGDLYEQGTSLYAVDFAFLPWLFEQSQTIQKKNVLGFFTFSDEAGSVDSCSEETMGLIANFFKRIEKTDEDNEYVPPFSDPNGQPFKTVVCTYGPFDRNYIVVTPGGADAVENQTSLVFAERIFYELYYLSDKYASLGAEVQAERTSRNGACFSGFSMVQVSRLNQLQHFYLKYILEEKITDYYLAEGITGSSSGLEKIKKTFFEMLDIPFDDADFPIDRAVKLFIKNKRNELSNLLNIYESNSSQDIEDYIRTCKSNISDKLDELAPQYDEFIRNEMDYMLNETLIKGFTSLFKINNLTGNINTYIQYLEFVRDRYAHWSESLKENLKKIPLISLDEDFDKAEQKIKQIQSSGLYKIPLLIPVRKLLIRNALYKLPLEQYFTSVIKTNITEALIAQWNDNSARSKNPVKDCNELISDLKELKKKLEKYRDQAVQKRSFIEHVPDFYYIISQKSSAEYSALLRRIESINFGTGKQSEIEQLAIDSFKLWTANKEYLQDITKNHTQFISHIDNYIENECKGQGFGHIETDTEEFSEYSRGAVGKMKTRASQLCEKTFHTNAETDYIKKDRIILNPLIDNEDFLSREISNNIADISKLQIPREFTLGSVIYFQEYLYLSRKSLQKYENLKDYEAIPLPQPVYVSGNVKDSQPSEKIEHEQQKSVLKQVSNEDLTTVNKYVRSVLLDYYSDSERLSLYNRKVQENVSELSENQVNYLATVLTIEEVLEKLTDSQLNDFARDIEVRVITDRNEQSKLLAYSIKKR